MIKICHMTSAHSPEDIRIFHKECISLANAGYEVFLIQRGDSYDKDGVHIVGIEHLPESRRKRMIEGTRMVYEKAVELDCDLYHIHDPELLPYGLKLKRNGKKVIFDSHELTREQIRIKPYLPTLVAKAVAFLYSRYENHVLHKIDGVIFPCPVKGQFPLPGKRQVFLNNFPRLTEMYDKYNPQAEKEPHSVCTVGSLTYNRGIKHLILAAHKARCKVILGGMLSPELFEKEVREMPESENVEFLGYLNRDEVREVYERSQICVSAILNIGQYAGVDNLSTKVFECMAMGLPVILTRQEFNERMINQYRFGVCVDPEDLVEFSETIRDLTDHPEKAQIMGVNGRTAVKEIFNWEKEEKNLFDLYKDILSE